MPSNTIIYSTILFCKICTELIISTRKIINTLETISMQKQIMLCFLLLVDSWRDFIRLPVRFSKKNHQPKIRIKFVHPNSLIVQPILWSLSTFNLFLYFSMCSIIINAKQKTIHNMQLTKKQEKKKTANKQNKDCIMNTVWLKISLLIFVVLILFYFDVN